MNAEYGFDAAVMNLRLGRREQALKILWETVRMDSSHADAWDLWARLEIEGGRPEIAFLLQRFAISANPKRFDLWHNQGMIEAALHLYPQAANSFAKSVSIHETFEGHFNWGNVLCNQMMIEEAIEHFERALALDKTENAQLLVNYGEALMAVNRWKEGFAHYRHRFNSPGFPPAPRNKYPLWRGEDLTGKKIMLYVEQGFGDEILSLRFAQTIKDTYEDVFIVLAVRPPMYRLCRELPFADKVILLYDDPVIQPDYTCPLLDVPAFIELSPKTVPCAAGYLKAEDRGFRLEMPRGLNVGLCWASGKRDLQPHVADTAKAKSLTFEQMTSIFAGLKGVNLFSLQQTHNDDAAMRAIGMRDPMSGITDFADTAFVMDRLDLIITVDTSVAHLAGAMGKPVWNLVRFDALWPWMDERGPCCWYDSMTIYRQTKPFFWLDIFDHLKADIRAVLDGRKPMQFTRQSSHHQDLVAAVGRTVAR